MWKLLGAALGLDLAMVLLGLAVGKRYSAVAALLLPPTVAAFGLFMLAFSERIPGREERAFGMRIGWLTVLYRYQFRVLGFVVLAIACLLVPYCLYLLVMRAI